MPQYIYQCRDCEGLQIEFKPMLRREHPVICTFCGGRADRVFGEEIKERSHKYRLKHGVNNEWVRGWWDDLTESPQPMFIENKEHLEHVLACSADNDKLAVTGLEFGHLRGDKRPKRRKGYESYPTR